MSVCGIERELVAFHYPPNNEMQPLNIQKFFFYDIKYIDNPMYNFFRWESVGAVCLQTKNHSEVDSPMNHNSWRVFYSMCELGHCAFPGRYVCLQVLMTLCAHTRVDFLVYDRESKLTTCWHGLDAMKFSWCLPDHKIAPSELNMLHYQLQHYCKRYNIL